MKNILTCFISLLFIYLFSNSSGAATTCSVNEFYSQNPIIYRQSKFKINSIDPSFLNASNSFPGLRGMNQLIVYTPKFGSRTGTNEFGSEAIAVNGMVEQMNGADSVIPSNGFVISGHGKAKKWINENLTVGSKVFIDFQNKELITFITPESFIFHAKSKLSESSNIINYYLKNDIYYNPSRSKEFQKKALDFLQKANTNKDDCQKYALEAIDAANKSLEAAIPYRNNEFKGIWIRPEQTSKFQIEKALNKIKSSGIDNIFLETYYHGKTIYNSEVLQRYGLQSQFDEFVGSDPLKIWINEAHKRKMKVHIWFETFYVGNKINNPKHILNVYPQWTNVTKSLYSSSIPVPSKSEHNGYFIDPANPEVQNFLLCLLQEIITKYAPDGINLDYIRYPQSADFQSVNYEKSNWGYTQYARNEFKQLYFIDPISIEKSSSDWLLWSRYRQDKITNFVARASRLARQNNVMLSAVIFPDRQKCLNIKMQDWKTWSIRCYVDALTPLILTCDKKTASLLLRDIKLNTAKNTKILAGLFIPFMDGSCDDMLRVIHETRKINTQGVVFFDYAHLDDKYKQSLMTSVFNVRYSNSYINYSKRKKIVLRQNK